MYRNVNNRSTAADNGTKIIKIKIRWSDLIDP